MFSPAKAAPQLVILFIAFPSVVCTWDNHDHHDGCKSDATIL